MFRFLYNNMPFFSARCQSQARLDGKTAVVTGCNTGIGKCTVADFYKRGARVIMACRDIQKAEAAKKDIITETIAAQGQELGYLVVKKLDLASLTSVRECAKDLMETEPHINILVNNAGVMMCPQGKTEDGFETQFGTNHLGHFLFTLLLLPKIRNSTPARIVTVSSTGHKYGVAGFEDPNFENTPYKPLEAYGISKLANILFSSELARRLKQHNITGVNTYSLHPGLIQTELGRHIRQNSSVTGFLLSSVKWFFKTPEQGAQTTIYCAVDESAANDTGYYYKECCITPPINEALDEELANYLWEHSAEMVNLGEYDPFETEKNTAETDKTNAEI